MILLANGYRFKLSSFEAEVFGGCDEGRVVFGEGKGGLLVVGKVPGNQLMVFILSARETVTFSDMRPS